MTAPPTGRDPADPQEETTAPPVPPVTSPETPDDGVEACADEAADVRAPERRTWVLLAVLVVLLLAAVATGTLWLAGRSVESDRTAALGAARSAAVALTSITFETADDDVRQVLDAGTGEFGDLFRQNLDSYIAMVRDSQVATTGEVTAAALSKADSDSASALVAVSSTVRNAASPQAQPRLYRMELDMVKEGDRWLVSKLEFVG